MSDVKLTRIRTSLSRQMAMPGGRTISDAIRKADAGLAQHRDGAMASLSETLAELEALCARRPAGAGQQVYDLAAKLLDLAGFFETGPLFEAIFSLCEISDTMMSRDIWSWQSVLVHVHAIRHILTEDCAETDAAKALITGLRAVTDRMRSTATA